MNIDREVELMKKMSVAELRQKFIDVFGHSTNTRNKPWLIKRIAWRMQANVEGDLSERARKRALEIANDADIRMMPPREPKRKAEPAGSTIHIPVASHAGRQLTPGQSITRQYKGENIVVRVTDNGFDWQGQHYKSLTAVVKAITGKHWNGYNFFRLTEASKEAR